MCGISGFNFKDGEKIAAMVEALNHRGPDAQGTFAEEGISLGHNRLAVIDLSAAANQPMRDAKGELVIVFNGEIYNFRELKAELEGSYEFRTKSDTEVILAGYRKWGEGVAERLNGMFAFAIWDRRDNSLFCARDHAGMKPLYYYWDGARFIFASEMRGIFAHEVPRRLNREAFNHYLRTLYTPEPFTLVENIFKLPAAHTLTLKKGALSVRPYREEPALPSRLSYREAATELKDKVLASVGRHLISDVPVGIYLSGGIDSSIMLAAASRSAPHIKTFSIGFDLSDGGEEEKFNADFELAARTSAHFGAEHRPIRISSRDALENFEAVTMHNSDPVSNPTSFAMLLLARAAKKEVSVALTGNGGDELFGGYDRYRLALAADYWRVLPKWVRTAASVHPRLRKLDAGTPELFAQFMFQKDARLSKILAPGVLEDALKVRSRYERYLVGGDSAERLMRADRLGWLPEHFFMLSDRMSMASALEERMPLLDKEVKTLAESLPRRYKVDLFNTKKILKDAFKEELPPYLLHQPKRGWFSPAAKWLRNPRFEEFARAALSESHYAGTRGLFEWDALLRMLERHVRKEEYNLNILWAVLTFQLWAKRYRIEA